MSELTRVIVVVDMYANERTENGDIYSPSSYNLTLKNPSESSKFSIGTSPGLNPLISSFPFWIISSTPTYMIIISGLPVSETSDKKCSPNGSTHSGSISDTGKGMWLLSRSGVVSEAEWKEMISDMDGKGLDHTSKLLSLCC